MLSNIAIAVFATFAIAYLVQLRALVKLLKKDEALWVRLGKPSLISLRGQWKFDRLIFHPNEVPITDRRLLQRISIAKFLMIASVSSFLVAVIAFFVAGKAGALPYG